jgi:tyrosine-protein kinase Etk/Wzc
MNENDSSIKEISFFPLLMTLVQARRLVLRNFLLTILLVLMISFLLPSRYTAVTTLMPPQDKDTSSMAGMLSQLSMPGIALPTPASTAQLFVEILKSRSVNDRVLNRTFVFKGDSLPLYKILRFPSAEIGYFKMMKKARYLVQPHDIIMVTVELGHPQLAADVANAYVEELDRVNQEKNVSRAKNSRIYIEEQLAETQKKMRASAEQLAVFQQQHKAVALENQVQASIDQAATLMGQVMAKEVEIGVMLQSMKPQNPLVIHAQNELEQMQKQINDLEYGDGTDGEKNQMYLAFQNVPAVALQLADLLRETKVQETVWQLLTSQYYQAKIEEARNTPTVQVLDVATPPLFRSSPNRKLMPVVFGVLSIVLTLLFVIVEKYLQSLRETPEQRHKLQLLRAEMQKDATFFKRVIRQTTTKTQRHKGRV